MEAAIRHVLSNIHEHVNDSDSDSDGEELGDPMDMLITGEGAWIHGNHQNLIRIWRGLRCLCHQIMPEHKGLLADATFKVFASFMYRWTAVEGSEEDSDNEPVSVEMELHGDPAVPENPEPDQEPAEAQAEAGEPAADCPPAAPSSRSP